MQATDCAFKRFLGEIIGIIAMTQIGTKSPHIGLGDGNKLAESTKVPITGG